MAKKRELTKQDVWHIWQACCMYHDYLRRRGPLSTSVAGKDRHAIARRQVYSVIRRLHSLYNRMVAQDRERGEN